MKDSYFEQIFTNKKGNYTIKEFIWLSDLENDNQEKFPKHPTTGEILMPVFKDIQSTFTILGKMSQKQIRVDRKKRSVDHFKKEIYPTLDPGSMEAKRFQKKHNLKKL